MKKNLLFIVVIACLIFTACNTGTTEAPSDEGSQATQPPAGDVSAGTDEPVATEALEPEPSGIVFVSNRGGGSYDLYLLDPDTLAITPLNTGLSDVVLPAWSPDGKTIAFATFGMWNIYTIQKDGTNLTQVTDFRSNNPDWSPDGTKLVFQSDHQNEPVDTPDIYTIDVTGENLVELLDNPAVIDFGPRWSPDGREILFISNLTGKFELFSMQSDGSNITQLTNETRPVNMGAWSPDGEEIAITVGAYPDLNICIITKQGLDMNCLFFEQGYNDSPSWSPDGESIVFVSDRSGNTDLWVINVDGTGLTQLTNDEFDDAFPDWGP